MTIGHRRIAFVGGESLEDIRERKAAYEEYMAEQGADMRNLPGAYIQPIPNTTSGGESALDELLRLAEPPTAIVAATDVIAIGLIHAAYERGVDVPGDLRGVSQVLVTQEPAGGSRVSTHRPVIVASLT